MGRDGHHAAALEPAGPAIRSGGLGGCSTSSTPQVLGGKDTRTRWNLEVEMVDNLITVEHVAEAIWQAIAGKDLQGTAVRRAWMALPIDEKEAWRRRAEDAIADWKRTEGIAPSNS